MKLSEIKEKVSVREEWVLPPFQREFVWNDEQKIIEFIESVFHEWPIGSIILWVPDPKDPSIIKKRKLQISSNGKPEYLQEFIIDGQQRITTLLRILNNESFILRGKDKKIGFDFSFKKFVLMEENSLPENTILLGDIINLKYPEIKNKLNIPVIYTTAHSDMDTISKAKSTAPYGFLNKPYNSKELYITIQIAIARHEFDMKLKESE
ncbi:MAG: DUF262 domain-containing protein, partial [Candidatus Omnitrophica bacterium]|nr:DUF262 domain-containing protein [Candidatus Omnitrophota bacterium]